MNSAPPRLVARPALTARLRAALSHALVAVFAPAGYGKTSAAALAVQAIGVPCVWYTAQLWHGGRFVEPLIEEARRLRDDSAFGRTTLAVAVEGLPATGSPLDLRAWAQRAGAMFVEELGRAGGEVIVVIDDAQFLDGVLALGEFLTGAMRVIPSNVHVLVAGRTLPAMPLPDWIAQGVATTFDARDLAFGVPETAALARSRRVVMDDAAAAQLCAVCEGWPAGLALSLSASDARVPTPAGTHQALTAYLIEQNLALLPPHLLNFLESTCVLETLEPAALSAHFEIPNALAQLEELDRRGIMLAVVKSGLAYRVHPLLRDAIAQRLRARLGDAAIEQLHRRAAHAFAAAHDHTAALHHALEGKDFETAREILRSAGEEMIASGRRDVVAAATGRMRAAGAAGRGLFGMLAGIALKQQGDPGARPLFEEALAAANAAGDASLAFRLRCLLVQDRLDRGDAASQSDVAALVAHGHELTPADEAAALVLAGWTAAVAEDFSHALSSVRAANALVDFTETVRQRHGMAMLEAYILTCGGDRKAAEDILGRALRSLEGDDHVVILAYVFIWFARLALLWGDVGAAAECVAAGVKLVRDVVLPSDYAGAYACEAEVRAHLGDARGCATASGQTRMHAAAAWYAVDRLRLADVAARMEARAEFLTGGVPRALNSARSILANGGDPVQIAAAMADAASYAMLCDADDADSLLVAARETISACAPRDAADAVTLASAAAAIAMLRSARSMPAAPELAAMPHLSAYRGLIDLRADTSRLSALGEAMAAFGASAAGTERAAVAAWTAARLRAAAAGPRFELLVADGLVAATGARRAPLGAALSVVAGHEVRHAAIPGDRLTKREREILEYVAEGYTSKEIAARLVLSVRTVDTHVDRVLGKLHVSSRNRAVAKAAREGLISANADAEDASGAGRLTS